jgi:hypothetical protein
MWDSMANSEEGTPSVGCGSGFDRGPGVYLLRVLNQQDPVGDWHGSNNYSLRVRSAGPVQPTIHAIGDMAMQTVRNTPLTEFHLAKVEKRYAGKDIVIDLRDVGDITGPRSDSFSIKTGAGAIPDCDWVRPAPPFRPTTPAGRDRAPSTPPARSSTAR